MPSAPRGVDGGERLLTGYSGRVSTVLAVGWTATLLGRQALSPLLPAIVADLGLSPAQAGFALTLMMGLYAAVQYPSGRVSDQLSRTTVLAAGVGVMVVGFGLLTTATGYGALLLGVSLVGIGAGCYFSPARAFVSDLFVERRGQAFGVHTAAGMVGGVLAATSAATVLAVATWRAAFLPSIALLVGVLVVLHRWSREPYVLDAVTLGVRATVGRLFASTRIRRLVVGYTLFAVTLQAFVGFLPTLLQVEKGFSPTLASGGFALVYVVGVVTGPLAGRLSDRFQRARVVVGALALGVVGLVVLLVGGSVPVVGLGIVLTAVGLWAYVPTVQAYLMDLLANDSLGGDFGLLKTVYTGLGSLGPTYVGVVAERASYTAAFAGLVGCLFASTVVVFVATRGD
ncbi:MAG: MFS transporter [Haloferacaceae archaeon]